MFSIRSWRLRRLRVLVVAGGCQSAEVSVVGQDPLPKSLMEPTMSLESEPQSQGHVPGLNLCCCDGAEGRAGVVLDTRGWRTLAVNSVAIDGQ